jgi:hypothetical protein
LNGILPHRPKSLMTGLSSDVLSCSNDTQQVPKLAKSVGKNNKIILLVSESRKQLEKAMGNNYLKHTTNLYTHELMQPHELTMKARLRFLYVFLSLGK